MGRGILRTGAALAALGLVAALVAVPAASAQQDTFSEVVEVQVVNVDVYVTDRKGQRITGLTADDFEVLEDGKKVKVSNFYAVDGASAEGAGTAAIRPGGRNTEEPLHLVVLVDNLNILPANRNRVLTQLSDFLASGANSGAEVLFATYDGSVVLRQPFSNDPATIAGTLAEISKQTTHRQLQNAERDSVYRTVESVLRLMAEATSSSAPGETAAMARGELDNLLPQLRSYAQSVYRDTAGTIQALSQFVDSLAGRDGRKAVIYVSDGLPLRPGEELFYALQDAFSEGDRLARAQQGQQRGTASADIDAGGLSGGGGSAPVFRDDQVTDVRFLSTEASRFDATPLFEQLAGRANAERVTFYAINGGGGDTGGLGADSSMGAGQLSSSAAFVTVRQNSLRDSIRLLSAATGGVALAGGTDVDGLLKRAQEDFRSYYSLGFTPRSAGDGEYHSIKVKVKGRGRNVRYREGYYAKPPQQRLADRLASALVLEMASNRHGLDLSVDGQEPTEDGAYQVGFLVKIPIGQVALAPRDGFHEAPLKLHVAVRGTDGRIGPVRQLPLSIKVPDDKLEAARSQYYAARLPLKLQAGEQAVAIALTEEAGGAPSVVRVGFNVGAVASSPGS